MCSAEEDKQVLDACEEWLRQAETLVDEAVSKIEAIMRPDGGSLLAEEWVTFVHKYSMQIKDIEQVMRSAVSHMHFLKAVLSMYWLLTVLCMH